MQILRYKQKMGCKPISTKYLKKELDFSKLSLDLKVGLQRVTAMHGS